jgi:DNA-binding transcriptional LysR family regulator
MDRLEVMSMLVAVAEAGSLTAAARTLKVPLPTLSRKVSDLESLIGARLLIRTTRKLTLTDAGSAYIAAARRILEQVDEAEREAAGEFNTPKGELVITAPMMFGRLHVLAVVSEFLARFPDINVRLMLADRNMDLVDAHVDMAVRIGRLPDSSMMATQVGLMRTVVCASPQLIAARKMPRTPEDLLTLPCVTVDAPLPSLRWTFKKTGSAPTFEVPVIPRLSVTTTEAAADAAMLGIGFVRLLHYQAIAGIKRRALQIVLEDFEPDPVPVSLLHAQRGQMPLKMRRFIDFAAPKLRKSLRP